MLEHTVVLSLNLGFLRVDINNLLDDKEGVLQEATNWKNQSATRQLQLEEIDSLERDMLDYVKGQLLTVIDLAGQICQKIEDNTDTEKESKISNFRPKTLEPFFSSSCKTATYT